MDCLIAMPAMTDRGTLCSAAMMPACVVGSPLVRNSMFLPRLCSIPEAAEGGAAAAAGGDAAAAMAAAAAAAAQNRAQQQQQHSSQQCDDDDDDEAACSDSCEEEDNAEEETIQQQQQDEPHPAVVASTWAISMRHFTDCIPITAETVCSTSTCHSLSTSMRGGSGEVGSASSPHAGGPRLQLTSYCSSSSQQQQQPQPGNMACKSSPQHGSGDSVLLPHSSSSSSSLLPAAADDGECSSSSALLDAHSAHDVDATEWLPWDRVTEWLETHSKDAQSATAAAHAHARLRRSSNSSSIGCGEAASSQQQQSQLLMQRADSRQQQQLIVRQGSSSNKALSQHQQQPSQEGMGDDADGVEDEAVFDAPEWWQESVRARLEGQREAFQSSWWCRLKILTGLAAQSSLEV